ncbi:MAG TPA: GNVR domain-containing protein [Stellaceae bacterium]|nr:GNVR domain-containing protein [Stellaceae bacterium]
MLDRVYNPPGDGAWTGAADASDTVSLSDAVAFLRRQFWMIAGTMAATVILAAFYVLSTPTGYVASAQLLIDPAKQQALWQRGNVVDLTLDNAQVESQVEVLLSERIGNVVIAALGLTNDPEFGGSGSSDYQRQRTTLDKFEGALSARRVGQSYVIEISFRSRDPAQAARITNAITDAYLKEQRQAKSDVAMEASQWMEDRITELGVELNTAAAAVQQFRVSHGIIETASNGHPQLIDQLTQLEARAEAYRKVYETLLERMTENQQQASYPVSDARVITSASQPLVKSYPRSGLVMLLSLLVGFVVGIAIAASRAMLDDSVQSLKQIRQALGLPVLGALPAHRHEQANGMAAVGQVEVIDAPLSGFSEAIRNVKISVHNASRERAGYCLGVVSLMPGEGASTVALNLAALFAGQRAKSLLIDANFRDRQLTRRVAPDARWGLIEAVRDGATETIVYDPKTRAYLLPLTEASSSNSTELLGSPAMQDLLPKLKEKFATILVDLPALSRTVDARAMAPLLDGCILVVAQGCIPLRALEDAVELLRADDVNLLGVVLNKVSDGIPPLFGVHLDEVRDFDYAGYFNRFVHVGSR